MCFHVHAIIQLIVRHNFCPRPNAKVDTLISSN